MIALWAVSCGMHPVPAQSALLPTASYRVADPCGQRDDAKVWRVKFHTLVDSISDCILASIRLSENTNGFLVIVIVKVCAVGS